MTLSRLASLSAVLALAACCSSKPAPATPTGGPGGPTADDVPPATLDISKLGADCGERDACEAGACTRYYGIAGPSGPEFKSCEVTCASGKGCPDGTACIQIADGPGTVCRPIETPDGPPIE